MLKVETYQNIEEKKGESKVEKQLSTEVAMIRCLDFLDFRAELQYNNPSKAKVEDNTSWIELNFINNDR